METTSTEWDMMNAACPTRQVLGRIADKWTLLVIEALRDGTLRFTEIRRRVDGITQKMLTQTLRALEHDGMVDREVIATVPVTVRYTLTPLGHSLAEVVGVFREWAYANIETIEAARAAHTPGEGVRGEPARQAPVGQLTR
jgi:DNA-binding HxlR family transcriptional regulator